MIYGTHGSENVQCGPLGCVPYSHVGSYQHFEGTSLMTYKHHNQDPTHEILCLSNILQILYNVLCTV